MSKLHAKIKLQLAIMLARDIQAHLAGDVSRFDRMVGANGKNILSLNDARANIQVICRETAGCQEASPLSSI